MTPSVTNLAAGIETGSIDIMQPNRFRTVLLCTLIDCFP
jgi:hypothetical protein